MLRVFLPVRCLNCDAHIDGNAHADPLEKYLCVHCLRIFRCYEPPAESELIDKQFRFESFTSKISLFAAFTFSSADQLLQRLIHHAKYHSMQKLALLLGIETASRLPAELKGIDYILPVPLHRTRYSERGFNQSECVAKGIASVLTNASVSAHYLKRVKPTVSQTGLAADEREENVRGAFMLSKKTAELRGKRLLLIDDVMTTGATLASAASELDKARPFSITIAAVSAVINFLPASTGTAAAEAAAAT